jgi:hypothetical protein
LPLFLQKDSGVQGNAPPQLNKKKTEKNHFAHALQEERCKKVTEN